MLLCPGCIPDQGPSFSLCLNTHFKIIFSSEYLSVLFLKNPGFSLKCLQYVTYYIENDFLHGSLARWISISLVNVWCFLGSCLCSHCEDGNNVLNSPLILIEKLISRLDPNCNG